ncbi:MAG: YIP1 family protein [Candidatus Micrarchaeota archaeon]|nr:YIP1 family protein [Candidatus Micrarchaeota archaeon]
MLKFQERTASWNNMMLSPLKTAALHAKNKKLALEDGLENFGMPILMTYLPLLLITLALSGKLELDFLVTLVIGLAATIVAIFIVSFVLAALAYVVASFLGGKASFGRLYYMISLASAPTFVFTIVINIAVLALRAMLAVIMPQANAYPLLQMAGDLVALSVTVYGFILLTICINALYKFGTLRSLFSWFAPSLAILAAGFYFFGGIIFAVMKFVFKTL